MYSASWIGAYGLNEKCVYTLTKLAGLPSLRIAVTRLFIFLSFPSRLMCAGWQYS